MERRRGGKGGREWKRERGREWKRERERETLREGERKKLQVRVGVVVFSLERERER